MKKSNLPSHANPCCGYLTDSSADLEELEKLSMPELGDMAICLNCGALLVYIDPQRNRMRYAYRIEVETMPRNVRQMAGKAQHYIRKRGWFKSEARKRDGN